MGTNAFSYQYDPIGNRLTSSNDVGGALRAAAYSANLLNQYTNILITDNGLPITNLPQYDADGNLTQSVTLSGVEWVTNAYTWDAENRMISVEPVSPTNGSKKVEFSYDYMGRRCKEVISTFDSSSWSVTATNISIFDGWHQISEVRSTLAALPSTNYWVWGIDLSGTLSGAGGIGGLLSWVRADTNAVASFQFAYDANGNVADLTDTNGAVVAHYEYDAYGNTLVATGSEAANNSYRFSTKRTLDGFNIVFYEHRIYLPELGRFGSKDPIGEEGGMNLYGFVGNSALNYIDLFGTAYVARRPVHGVVAKTLAPKYGYEPYHWQIFFEDGESPPDLGLFGDNSVRSDDPEYMKEYTSTVGFTDYEDCLMRLAVEKAVAKYGTTWRSKDNCQDFVNKVIIEYGKLRIR